jgi:hypothetical protein
LEEEIAMALLAERPVSQSPEEHAAAEFEPFTPTWRPTIPDGAVVLNYLHLAAIGFVILIALVAMTALAYVAGRVATEGPSRVINVESVQAKPVAVIPSVSKPVVDSAVVDSAKAPAQINSAAPAAGESYLQVGALDRGMANVSLKYLQDSGIPARLEAVADSPLWRVLVGPLDTTTLAPMKQKLDELGFPSFLKQY